MLANEFLATRLAALLSLPVPEVEIIEVSDSLIESSPGLQFEIGGISVRCAAGLHVGVRHVADPWNDCVFDYLPESTFDKVMNRQAFAGILAFDKWTGNTDGRQAVFTKHGRGYHVTFIDQGYCFNAAEWNFPDLPLHGAYYKGHVYEDIAGWDSFEPVLSRIEAMEYADLWRCAAPIPLDWFEHDGEGLFQLIEALHERRSSVRTFITAFRDSSRNPFPRWTAVHGAVPQGRRSIKEEEAAPELALGGVGKIGKS